MTRVKYVLILMLTLAAGCSCGEEVERVDLSYFIDKAASGFTDIRGNARDSTDWDTLVLLSGAKDCYIDWTKRPSQTNPSFHCLMLDTGDPGEARRLYLRLIDLAAGMEPGWKQVREAPSHEDDFRSIAEFTPRDTVNRQVDVQYSKVTSGGAAGKYFVSIIVWSGVSIDAAARTAEGSKRDMAGWVSEDVHEFLAAAAGGFAAYKSGDPAITQGGGRTWVASRKPLLAELCEVQEQEGRNAYFCVLSSSPHKFEIEAKYNELVADVKAALPDGWSSLSRPPFTNVVASKAFTSPNGMTGAIWIAFDSTTKQYSLDYQIISNLKH